MLYDKKNMFIVKFINNSNLKFILKLMKMFYYRYIIRKILLKLASYERYRLKCFFSAAPLPQRHTLQSFGIGIVEPCRDLLASIAFCGRSCLVLAAVVLVLRWWDRGLEELLFSATSGDNDLLHRDLEAGNEDMERRL